MPLLRWCSHGFWLYWLLASANDTQGCNLNSRGLRGCCCGDREHEIGIWQLLCDRGPRSTCCGSLPTGFCEEQLGDCFVGVWQNEYERCCCQFNSHLDDNTCWKDHYSWSKCCAGSVSARCPYSVSTWNSTQSYWENRYAGGLNSFPTLASCPPPGYVVRTEFIKAWLESVPEPPRVIIDLGVGDGCQAWLTTQALPTVESYIGLDLSETAVRRARFFLEQKMQDLTLMNRTGPPQLEFHAYDGYTIPPAIFGRQADIAISLQVLMHVLEDTLFEAYMGLLFSCSSKYVLIQAVDDVFAASHIRLWRFTEWIERKAPSWRLILRRNITSMSQHEAREGDALWLYMRIG